MHGEIYKILEQDVEKYFTSKKLAKTGRQGLHLTALTLFLIFIGSYFWWLILGQNIFFTIFFTILLGLSAGILGAFGHEAIHRAFAKEKWLNNLMIYFQDFVGKSSFKYNLIHPKHHIFTNVDGADPDLNIQPLLRLHPDQPYRPWHKFQHLYAPLVYALAAFSTVYDFKNYFTFIQKERLRQQVIYIVSKIWHILVFLVVPVSILGWQKGLVGYGVFMITAGLYFAAIIQPSHLYPNSEFSQPNSDNLLNEEWTKRMIATTSNYANGSNLLSILYAGMDYHIVHQLFPTVSMVHFPELNKIIRSRILTLGLPYVEHKNLLKALQSHFQFLKQMSKVD
jgi:linoleoyl-CoA desaturase